METNSNYYINLNDIKNTFKMTEKGLTHKSANRIKLFPFVANDKNLISEFTGVTGEFSRMVSHKEIKTKFEAETFIEEVAEQVAEYENDEAKVEFKNVIKSMFINQDDLVYFDIKTLNYIHADSSEQKVAKFLFSVLFDEQLNEAVDEKYNREIKNMLYKLVLQALPTLDDKKYSSTEYFDHLPFVKVLFVKDFEFLISNEEFYKKSLKRLLEFYYMFYVSQLTMKLNQFDQANYSQVEPLYYTLDWEKTSKTRTAYEFGWEKIKGGMDHLFPHAIVLEMLNHHDGEEKLTYHQISKLLEKQDSNNILDLTNLYIKHLDLQDGVDYKAKLQEAQISLTSKDNEGFEVVKTLFEVVKYQFDQSKRHRAKEAYKNWFVRFVNKNFGKRRGQLGYNLNLTEDDIILLTKLCINKSEKIKLKTLFEELELRGIFLDKYSKEKVVQLYEKLNILEKKSDSGDAQYVKAIL